MVKIKYERVVLLLFILVGVVSCVSVGKNIKKAEEMLNQAQSMDARIFAKKDFDEATTYYIAAKLDRYENRKKANNEAIASRQLAQSAYYQSLAKRLEKQRQSTQTVKNEALAKNAQILAEQKFKEADIVAKSAAELRSNIEKLAKRLKVFEIKEGVNYDEKTNN